MTMTTPMGNFPGQLQPYTNITPFTYRDGVTYQELLEDFGFWLRDTLVPHVDSETASLAQSWADNITTLINQVNTALTTQTADNDAKNAALTAQTDAAVQSILGATIEISDSAVNSVLTNSGSTSVQFLDTRYVLATSYATLNDLVMTGRLSQSFLDGRYAPASTAADLATLTANTRRTYPLTGAGIDPTGTAVSTTAVQAIINGAPDGATVVVPDGAVLNIDAPLTVGKRLTFIGGGELRFTAGIANASAITANVDGVTFDGIYLTNPNLLAGTSGNRNFGISFNANIGRVVNCRIEKFNNGIEVKATGEFHDFVISDNFILDVNGVASEDRGDGIMVWGAVATITGNRVSAKAGTDARIGIHCEGLSGSIVTHYPNENAVVTISGNIVTGQFRRGITAEDMQHVAITGNVVTDPTWWGISVNQSTIAATIADNTIKWTRTVNDLQGNEYSPRRAGIMVYGNVIGCTVTGNTINVTASGNIRAYVDIQAATTASDSVIVSNNVGTVATGGVVSYGVDAINSTGMVIDANRFNGFNVYGVWAYNCINPLIAHNRLSGAAATQGIMVEANTNKATILGNSLTGCTTGISRMNGAGNVISSNVIDGATTGIDVYGCTNTKALGNVFINATTQYANTGGTGVVTS